MKWFGVLDDREFEPHVDTPVGQPCAWCEEAIQAGDNGVMLPYYDGSNPARLIPYHTDCQMRAIVGGLNHLAKRCSCCGGTLPPDPPEMTRREAATAAARAYAELRDWRARR